VGTVIRQVYEHPRRPVDAEGFDRQTRSGREPGPDGRRHQRGCDEEHGPTIGLDTNVLVRYLTQDDATQAALANEFVDQLTESQPGYLTMNVLAETYWFLCGVPD
jgi:hypothetical protein